MFFYHIGSKNSQFNMEKIYKNELIEYEKYKVMRKNANDNLYYGHITVVETIHGLDYYKTNYGIPDWAYGIKPLRDTPPIKYQ